MSDPIIFASSTPQTGLPLLIAGQAQKEFFVNKALCILDALHPRAVTGSQPAPPDSAPDGACYRVTAPAQGQWTGHEDDIAVLIGGAWHFVGPQEGIALFDRMAGHLLVFRGHWNHASAPANPAGGAVVDGEARAAVIALVQALATVGILAAT